MKPQSPEMELANNLCRVVANTVDNAMVEPHLVGKIENSILIHD